MAQMSTGNFTLYSEHLDYNWGPGVGDYLHVMSLVSAWLDAYPDTVANVFYPDWADIQCINPWADVVYTAVPAVDIRERRDFALFNYWNLWNVPRCRRYDNLGLDWYTKRLYYFTTPAEVLSAHQYWDSLPGDGCRVCLQWQGGDRNKTHPEWTKVLTHLDEMGCRVAVLDHRKEGPIQRRIPAGGVRFALSLCATADLFIGFDSGPLYAALGSLVPCIGLFPNEHPEDIFAPIRDPDYTCLIEPRGLWNIPISLILEEIDRMWFNHKFKGSSIQLTQLHGDQCAQVAEARYISRRTHF